MIKRAVFNLLVLLMGLLMGPFSSYLFLNVLHFPLVVPELVFIPFFFLFYRQLGISFEGKVSFVGIFLLWLLFLVIAFLWGTWDMTAVLSTGRSFLVLGLFYAIGSKIRFDEPLAKVLLVCSIGSILGWVIKSYFNLQSLAFLDGYEESVVYGNLIAIVYAFSISLLMNSNYLTIAFVFAINVFLSFTSSLRRQISVSVLSLLLSLGVMSLRSKRFDYLILVVVISIPVYLSLPRIEKAVADLSPNMHYRIFERTQDFLEGDWGNSEKGRANHQLIVFQDFFELIIPHGYVSQHTGQDAGTGTFNDVPIYMLAYSFGVITLFIYLIYYVIRLCVLLSAYIKQRNSYYGVVFVTGTIILFLHFIDSQMFTVSYTAPFTGLTLGLLFRKTITKNAR